MLDLTGRELSEQAKLMVPKISCEDYKKLKDSGTSHILLDVREDGEWDDGHMDGAVHVPRGVLEFKIPTVAPDKNVQIVICCARGSRAALAGQTLIDLGYTNPMYLEGGFIGWCLMDDHGKF